ncbi:tRNA (guanosine(37)-N1)-methyltransferase TrmD [Candidatus Kaiserbacteria bacterium RIFCSPLOWO2_12_FULL_53_8]|uniref:tRNA (guanine-N(1)-)-methyltransferase n=2 Tax=Candidatus Kaiseribacteriota TaxID=1752734 RepID=A0A1F6CX67_9BACT|nr:MAG: tRNA (guanosine(37)-N1)-methyltransferase TrmD [Candidatus Kaiserbacteria bacterium RIFCSPHIGHO2_01_FULL_53_29]OGG90905.1 MAG: tRNA (guanosine(37)-N1)-methyltransferase TrmD [Candidatus Kaiserbacteria bacterium RIFCSPLOWO2_12_FULL_53_8]
MIHFHIVTLFPESIEPYLKSSIIGRAIKAKKIKISYYDPKKFTHDKYGRVDRRPYGGGPGMVLEPDGILRAADAALKPSRRRLGGSIATVFFSTDGTAFDEAMAKKLATKKDILFICGHYEGVDARVQKILKAKKISIGPYVLTGGELPAATVIDCITRLVPGVLGKAESLEASRVSSPEVYTRPEALIWKGRKYKVPKVLLSGHHAKIEKWKKSKRTKGG